MLQIEYFAEQLLIMCSSRQDGALATSIQGAVAKGKEVADKDDAIKKFTAGSQSTNLQDVAIEIGNSCNVDEMASTEDVTASFLSTTKFLGPACATSRFFVYKGLVQLLMGRKVDENMNTLGVVAGTDNSAVEVCLGSDVSSILSCPELKERWNKLGFGIIGLVAWDHQATPSKYTEEMAKFMSMPTTDGPILLMVCNNLGDPDTWEFNTEWNPGAFVAVDIISRNKNRRKDVDYKVFPVDRVGVTVLDHAQHVIAKAVEKYLISSSSSTTGFPAFQKWSSPPDGYCFWHAVLAGLDKSYLAVKRYENGFPVNARREKHESAAAKNLMKASIAPEEDADAIFKNGFVELQQISGVAQKLNLAIRVTVSDEARSQHIRINYIDLIWKYKYIFLNILYTYITIFCT